MASRTPLVRNDGAPQWTLRFDADRRIPAAPGETVSAALLADGVVATTRSLKFRRPRGPYCLQGDCGTCLVRIDGRPNLRACLTPCAPHRRVGTQNTVPHGPDPTALADKFFGKGMDHHHFMVKPRVLNELMKGIARNLAGLGTLPDPGVGSMATHRHHTPDALVIGCGSAGRAMTHALRQAGLEVMVVERFPRIPAAPKDALAGTGVFGVYAPEATIGAAQPGADVDTLHTFAPAHLVFATGARDTMMVLPNNDLPGVVSATGLARQLEGTTLAIGRCVLVGASESATQLARQLGVQQVDPADVIAIVGDDAVEAVQCKGKTIECELVALAPPPAPASDLARQDGAEVRWDGNGFAVVRDDLGRTGRRKPWTSWACGDVCGFMGPDDAARDAQRVAGHIAQAHSHGAQR